MKVTTKNGVSFRLKKKEDAKVNALATYLETKGQKDLFMFLVSECITYIEDSTGLDLESEYLNKQRAAEKRRLQVSEGWKIRKKD